MTAETREEKYLQAIAAGEPVAYVPVPVTRVEKFLYRMLDDSAEIPEAITRIEKYLAAIIENGTGGRAKLIDGIRLTNSTFTSFPSDILDTSEMTDMSSFLNNCANLTEVNGLDTRNAMTVASMLSTCPKLLSVGYLDTSKAKSIRYLFYNDKELISVPELDTRNVTEMLSVFYNCSKITKIPLLNTSNVTTMQNMFYNCSSLSNDSLNNILMMCINANNITSNKTLKYIGLSSAQATKCATLSNWQAFLDAGWTSGY